MEASVDGNFNTWKKMQFPESGTTIFPHPFVCRF